MSTATDLLLIAKNNGLLLSLEGENLRVRWQGVPPSQDLLASIKTHKPQLISLLAINDHPYIEDRPPTWSMDRYAHMVKCQQCEHLTDDDHCRVKAHYKPMPEARHECDYFELLKSEREPIQAQPYTATELLTHYEKPLFNHLLACPYCHVEAAQYCVQGNELGSMYDALLVDIGDTLARRANLALRVDKARISGRNVFRSKQ